MNAPTHTNFFEQRSTEYGKGEIEGWGEAFDFLAPSAPMEPVALYRVYTMPGCSYCRVAVDSLVFCAIPHTVILIEDGAERARMKATNGDWRTFPMVFSLDTDGNEIGFVGGAEALAAQLA